MSVLGTPGPILVQFGVTGGLASPHPGCVTFEGRIALGPPSIPPGACLGGQRAISVDSVDAKLTEIVAIGLQFWSSRRQFATFWAATGRVRFQD